MEATLHSQELYFSPSIGMQQLVMQMSEFFTENPQYKLMDYEPISRGLRFYWVVVQ
jgi:hypothetical protein